MVLSAMFCVSVVYDCQHQCTLCEKEARRRRRLQAGTDEFSPGEAACRNNSMPQHMGSQTSETPPSPPPPPPVNGSEDEDADGVCERRSIAESFLDQESKGAGGACTDV